MRRRGQFDICADLLNAVHDGGDRTHIIFKTRMTFDRFNVYIEGLEKGGLVKAQADPRSPWAVTDRGYEYLEKYRALKELLPSHLIGGERR